MAVDTTIAAKFCFGCIANCTATLCLHPLDMLKVQLQVSSGTTLGSAFRDVVSESGPIGLWRGLSAGLLRQIFYGTSRFGIFQTLTDRYTPVGEQLPFYKKVAFGLTAGGLGACIGTPAEVALVRMSADSRLPIADRRNYSNGVNAMLRIAREEGTGTLWRGGVPTVQRAMILNAAQLGTFAQAKDSIRTSMGLSEGVLLTFIAANVAGVVTTAVSVPMDVVKSQIQNQVGSTQLGVVAVMKKIIRNDGLLGLWRGTGIEQIRVN